MKTYDYDVAISVAGEDRSAAEKLIFELVSRKIRIFYDKMDESTLWGKDLVESLHEIFSKRAGFCLIFVSKYYLEKQWPKHEKRSALERALSDEAEYILPLQMDETRGCP